MITELPLRCWRPLVQVVTLLVVLGATDGAPVTFYGVNIPDPLHVYTLQEINPENIRNDPFLVVFKTHIPSLRPYEIPYFPPKDRYADDEKDDENAVANNSETSGNSQPADQPPQDSKEGNSGGSKGKPNDKIDFSNLPELVELKPEILLEALDVSKIDSEEGQTTPPAEFLSDSPSQDNSENVSPNKSENDITTMKSIDAEKEQGSTANNEEMKKGTQQTNIDKEMQGFKDETPLPQEENVTESKNVDRKENENLGQNKQDS